MDNVFRNDVTPMHSIYTAFLNISPEKNKILSISVVSGYCHTLLFNKKMYYKRSFIKIKY